MEARYRLASGPVAGSRMGRLPGAAMAVRAMAGLLLAGLLAGCQAPAGGEAGRPATSGDPAAAPEAADGPPLEKLPVIVNLVSGDGPGISAAARVMERLAAILPAEELAAVRTFNLLPIIALDADGALLARLLAMPEVASIERDRELRLLEPPPVPRTQ